MKKNILILCLSLLSSIYCQAQIGGQLDLQNYRDIGLGLNVAFGQDRKDISEINGSPFLYEDFDKGKVIDNANNMSIETNLRYDVLNDIFEIRINPNDTELKKLNRSFNYEYILNGERFVLIQSDKAIKELHYDVGNGFVAVLSDSDKKAVLYKRYFAEKKEGKKAQSSYQKDTPPKIDVGHRYIIKFNEDYVNAEAHKKKVLDAFPDKVNEIEKFIKTNKLKFRGDDSEVENDLIMIINHYNTL